MVGDTDVEGVQVTGDVVSACSTTLLFGSQEILVNWESDEINRGGTPLMEK